MSLPVQYIMAAGGKRAATKIVAAANTLDKTGADYVCDGVDDQVEINKAISDIASTGGSVLLLEGTFYVTAPIYITSNIMLYGCGLATSITWAAASQDTAIVVNADQTNGNTNIIIADMCLNGNNRAVDGIRLVNVSSFLIIGVYAQSMPTSGSGIYLLSSRYGRIVACHIIDTYIGIRINRFGGTIVTSYRIAITSNVIRVVSQGIVIDEGTELTISNNVFNNSTVGISSTSNAANRISITGNTFSGHNLAISLSLLQHIVIANNVIYNIWPNEAIYLSSCQYCLIEANLCTGIADSGIELSSSSHCVVIGNSIIRANTSYDTYAAIALTGASSLNYLTGNICRRVDSQTKYGIGIHSNQCNNNLLVNNDLRTSGLNGDIYDVGVGTIGSLTLTMMAVDHFLGLMTSSLTHVLGLMPYDSTAHTSDITSPDRPRNVSASLYNGSAAPIDTVACTCTVTGVNAMGSTITETISIPAYTGLAPGTYHTIQGSIAFVRITSVQFSAATQPTGTQMCVGIGNKLGLSKPITAVQSVKRNQAEVIGACTINTTNNTVEYAIEANDSISVYYTTALGIKQNAG